MRLILSLIFLGACLADGRAADLDARGFRALLDRLALAWNEGDARAAADCFTIDAIYVEPPDRQLYRGRKELYRFFGGDAGRPGAMNMAWHNVAFDEESQIGLGEFTFSYGSQVHGGVVLQAREGRIRRWREYWYESPLAYSTFAGESAFVQGSAVPDAELTRIMEAVARAWNASDAEAAAALFSEDAVYLEPPDKQTYHGRAELRDFFAETARIAPMRMTWHHLAFDSEGAVAAGEYTFDWNGRKLHGIVFAQLAGDRIRRWREYQYPSTLDWEAFVNESAFEW